MKKYLLGVLLANCLLIFGVITKDYSLLIPLNLGILWGFLKSKSEAE